MKKKATKSKAAKSMRDLPAKRVNAKTASGVKGGENITFEYGKYEVKYTHRSREAPGRVDRRGLGMRAVALQERKGFQYARAHRSDSRSGEPDR
jgi:hypothetical protein